MKITNWKRKLVAALVAGGIMAPGALNAAPLNTNLVVDPGFEDVGTPAAVGAYLNSWQDGSGTDYAYAVSAGYDNGGPLGGGGLYYFNSNYADPAGDVLGPGVVSQNIDISTGESGALIASGEAAFSMSGFFSSFGGDGDFGTLHVEFLDGGGGSLGTSQVSDGDTTTWSQHTGAGPIPIGTATARLSLFGTPLAGGPDGYIDNVDFRVTDEEVFLPALDLAIDRRTGNIVLSNQTASPVHISGYSITSGFGAMAPDDWLSIAENYDAGNPDPVDPNNNWSELTQPDAHGDLSEADLDTATGTMLAVDASIDLGDAWIQNPDEDDLVFQYISEGQVELGIVGFNGAGGPLQLGDLDFDGDLDVVDWGIFRSGQHADMTGLSGAEAYQLGDLTGDMANNHPDFVAFKTAFDEANGAGAFDGMVGVPEPSSMVLIIGVGLSLLAVSHRRRT